MKYNKLKRRVLLKAFENLNVIMWHMYGEYSRLLRIEYAGLTEKEQKFLHRQVDDLHTWLLRSRKLRDHIYKDVSRW